MTTVAQLIDQCSDMLHSYTATTEAATFLTQSIDADDVAFTVAHPTRLKQGFIEIGEELMRVVAGGTDSVTLFPDGRGANGSLAVAHPVNTRVTNDPLIPRVRLFDEVKATVRQLKELFAEKTFEFLYMPTQTTYEVPADCRRILRVEYQEIGPSQEWIAVYKYKLDPTADTVTGKSLSVWSDVYPGRRVQVVYAADLPVPATTTVDLETSGIPFEMHDLIRFGVCWRAVQMLAPGRMNLRSIEAQTDAAGVDPNSITNVAKQFLGMFQLRRDEERQRLLDRYPVRKHLVR